MILRDEARLAGADSIELERRTDSLYSAYRFTRSRIDSTLRGYRRELAAWKKFYEKVVARLEELQRNPRVPRGS